MKLNWDSKTKITKLNLKNPQLFNNSLLKKGLSSYKINRLLKLTYKNKLLLNLLKQSIKLKTLKIMKFKNVLKVYRLAKLKNLNYVYSFKMAANKRLNYRRYIKKTFRLSKYNLFKHNASGIYNIYFLENPIKTDVVAADFNKQTKRLVFKKKESIKYYNKNFFKRKWMFNSLINKIKFSYIKLQRNKLNLGLQKKRNNLKFFINYKSLRNCSSTSNSFFISTYKEVNFRIKKITLIPTIMKTKGSQKTYASIPSKIPVFFINFLFKHH